ncbi:uncharacterized protein FTOL_10497 [Fusarium torulosum]|uniref:Uncharacterized protein n=1 Tax=Fusarium torulosum TaxID=33205 RepID=A0AAE8SMD3_9HYPO|nr:uncharacterized protein FTOL_10497 [Fusarium torulosum]
MPTSGDIVTFWSFIPDSMQEPFLARTKPKVVGTFGSKHGQLGDGDGDGALDATTCTPMGVLHDAEYQSARETNGSGYLTPRLTTSLQSIACGRHRMGETMRGTSNQMLFMKKNESAGGMETPKFEAQLPWTHGKWSQLIRLGGLLKTNPGPSKHSSDLRIAAISYAY